MTLEMRDQLIREEADHNARWEIAKKMLADGWDHTLIAKYSGLRIEEVEALAQPQPM